MCGSPIRWSGRVRLILSSCRASFPISTWKRLSAFSRLILFDKRGTGLSDRVDARHLPSLETRMDDVRAVMNAAGSGRAALLGASEGAPMAMLFAATYPERTRALTLYGGYAPHRRVAFSSAGKKVRADRSGQRPTSKGWPCLISGPSDRSSCSHERRAGKQGATTSSQAACRSRARHSSRSGSRSCRP